MFVSMAPYIVILLTGMGMSMKVDLPTGVVVKVEVDTLLHQPSQYVYSEQDQHGADRQFQ